MALDELVLCTARRLLPPAWLPACGALPLTAADLHRHLTPLAPEWLPRSLAETDPAYKQWIPYSLLQLPDGRLASYPRQGTEARLHGLHSLGIGGHINPADAPSPFDWIATFQHGFHRELTEEYPAASPGTTRLLGLINEDVGAVGRVHLGLVFHHRLDLQPVPPDGELAGLAWLHPADHPSLRYETWSRLALSLLPPPPLRP